METVTKEKTALNGTEQKSFTPNHVMVRSDAGGAKEKEMMRSIFLSGEMRFNNGEVEFEDGERFHAIYHFKNLLMKLQDFSERDHTARIEVLRDMASAYIKDHEDPEPALQMLTDVSFIYSECVHQYKIIDQLLSDIDNIIASR